MNISALEDAISSKDTMYIGRLRGNIGNTYHQIGQDEKSVSRSLDTDFYIFFLKLILTIKSLSSGLNIIV